MKAHADKKFRVYYEVDAVYEKRGARLLKRAPENKVVYARDERDARDKVESDEANRQAFVKKVVAL